MKHLKRILWVVVALMMIAVLSASASAESVTLAFNQASYECEALQNLWLDDQYTFTGDPGTLIWTSSDPSIARVYNNGRVYGKKPGEVTITLTGTKGGKAETKVVVKENAYKTLTISPATLTLEAGNSSWFSYSYTLTDDTKPATQDSNKIIWTSSDEAVAQAGSYGNVYAVDEGTATITATIKNLDGTEVSATATVTVLPGKKLTSMKFVRDSYTMKYSDAYKALKLTGSPQDALYDADISFESSDEQIATVDAYYDSSTLICRVYPQKPGTVTITAKYEEDPAVVATTTVTIEAKPVSKVSLNRTKLTLSDNRTTYDSAISFKVEPSGAYYDSKETYWESSDTDIIYVNGYGSKYVNLGIGDQYGTATITAYVWDGTTWHTASCEVTVISQDTGISLNITKKTIYLYARDNQSDSKDSFGLTASNDVGDDYPSYRVKWSTSKKKVATVNRHGVVKAVGTGTAKITAKGPDGSTATCKVTVKKNLVKKIKGNKQITMRVGATDYILPDSEYGGGLITTNPKWGTLYDPTFSFESSNDDVVSVNANGVLKANGLGAAKITVKAKDGSKKKFTFTVNVIEPLK